MIIYDLACPHGHHFEGWFASGADFAEQQAGDLVRCPVCDDAGVAIVPSAKVARSPPTGSAVRRGFARSGERRIADSAAASGGSRGGAPEPAEAMADNVASGLPAALLSKLREIVRAAEDVGHRFPEEARRIHYDEVPARPIRGQASREETEELREEGIEVSPLPPFLIGDEH